MNGPIIQLLVLAGIAIFLVLRLRGVLGTREGFEKPPVPLDKPAPAKRDFEVIEGGPDRDIIDHADEGTSTALALAEMKRIDPSFNVGEFLSGARQAYEMILMAFERGDLDEVKPFISEDIEAAFTSVIHDRADKGLTVDATFVGISELKLRDATFDQSTKEAELTIRFGGELAYVVRDHGGDIVDGDPNAIKKQKDVWTFARVMDSGDPNWRLVATE
ncbi:Predicted lipid-binding transport protein, Tim44 family [Loktanella sp. DSM 29012]|uniref:Tim44/TimA family putative adaptor protein n=1 Tax=Loktanella gaetbuli TaxID=2881335 RepID=A0ABS8BU11_9RHOB|nr:MULTISPECIES: Tim44/TimA family putative adaptor protein [Loktanella]MCB5199203.1 Tim44/TimA family putative adaptor protein [Loktanella gaetbuli]SEP60994.1 Predicted lipid-binding transport protein, Tim44 family [Loktanella sp. DSM 29012]